MAEYKQDIKVMVVDDSALVRKVISDILNKDRNISVIAQASDPFFAMRKLEKQRPDCIVLDIEMPRMDGITFLKKLMHEQPIPVVICSSLTRENAGKALEAIQAGAVEIISKPVVGVKGFLEESAIQIVDAVKATAQVKLKKRSASRAKVTPKYSADVILPRQTASLNQTSEKIIALGASTGGTEALQQILAELPAWSPGILIVQHMPANFTAAFAERINGISALEVREACSGDLVHNGLALVAPGGKHMLIKRKVSGFYVDIIDGPLVNRHRPSVDVLFRSVARFAGANAIACLLTGMGDDGAEGLKEIRDAGSRTFAQDKTSSVVFGMPQAAWKKGAVEKLLHLNDISNTLLESCGIDDKHGSK